MCESEVIIEPIPGEPRSFVTDLRTGERVIIDFDTRPTTTNRPWETPEYWSESTLDERVLLNFERLIED